MATPEACNKLFFCWCRKCRDWQPLHERNRTRALAERFARLPWPAQARAEAWLATWLRWTGRPGWLTAAQRVAWIAGGGLGAILLGWVVVEWLQVFSASSSRVVAALACCVSLASLASYGALVQFLISEACTLKPIHGLLVGWFASDDDPILMAILPERCPVTALELRLATLLRHPDYRVQRLAQYERHMAATLPPARSSSQRQRL